MAHIGVKWDKPLLGVAVAYYLPPLSNPSLAIEDKICNFLIIFKD